MSTRKIGLLNLQYIDNYGANLISFAMEQTVKELVDDVCVETINYVPDELIMYKQSETFKNRMLQYGFWKTFQYYSKKLLTSIKSNIRNNRLTAPLKKGIKRFLGRPETQYGISNPNASFQQDRLNNFAVYRNSLLNMSPQCESGDFSQFEYDTIVVGSDVVWKPQRLLSDHVNKAFFLIDKGVYKRIAYAASLGISDKKQMQRLKKHYTTAISHFDAISIRESSGTEYIQSLFSDRKIYNCIDPVFLRPATEYAQIGKSNEDTEPYIYAYIIGKNLGAIEYTKRLAKEKNLKILFHSTKAFDIGTNTISDGPCEFLDRIKNAEYIITDSFHGTAFSIIFKKQFYSFTRGVLSVRLENFMTQIGLKSRLLSDVDETTNIDSEIPYEKVWEYLDSWIANSKKFLSNALNSEDKI